MNANVFLLALSQALMMTLVGLVLSSSALVAVGLSAPAGLANLPLAAQYLATLLVLHPAARLMGTHGRRPVFVGAALVGVAGLLLAARSIAWGSFPLFVLAGLGIGVLGRVGQFYRFAAIEAVPPARKGLAVSLTLTGGVLAAFLGPWLARSTRHLFETPFLASFLILAALAVLAAVAGGRLRLPPPPRQTAPASPRPARQLLADPGVGLAVAAAVVAYGVMNLLMTATPLAMLCAGQDFDATATVIQWHLVAMFAPSFLTGGLIGRIGALSVMALGVLASLAAIGIALLGERYGHFQVALVLVGLGWNLLYVGATTRLAEGWRDEEKGRLQALNDSLVFAAVTLATFAAAPLVDRLGWALVNGLAALPLLVLLGFVARALLRGRARLASAG